MFFDILLFVFGLVSGMFLGVLITIFYFRRKLLSFYTRIDKEIPKILAHLEKFKNKNSNFKYPDNSLLRGGGRNDGHKRNIRKD